jgi:hypothetical protein
LFNWGFGYLFDTAKIHSQALARQITKSPIKQIPNSLIHRQPITTMASLFGHIAVSTAIGYAFFPKQVRPLTLVVAGFCAFAPDLDVLAFRFGIPYESEWGAPRLDALAAVCADCWRANRFVCEWPTDLEGHNGLVCIEYGLAPDFGYDDQWRPGLRALVAF